MDKMLATARNAQRPNIIYISEQAEDSDLHILVLFQHQTQTLPRFCQERVGQTVRAGPMMTSCHSTKRLLGGLPLVEAWEAWEGYA